MKTIQTTRKGAIRSKDVPVEILHLLNNGTIESVNLTEWLAVNHFELLEHVLSGYPEQLRVCRHNTAQLNSPSVRQLIIEIGRTLSKEMFSNPNPELFNYLVGHPSDSVRCWAAYIVGFNPLKSLGEKLSDIYVLAADKHFGVREIAWMALRDDVNNALLAAVNLLKEWAISDNENIRRFAVEILRPRGVWCKHIELVKTNPEIALPVLESVKADPSEYVRLSVGNWLNDAGKTNLDWVFQLCNRWAKENQSIETSKILKRARRNL